MKFLHSWERLRQAIAVFSEDIVRQSTMALDRVTGFRAPIRAMAVALILVMVSLVWSPVAEALTPIKLTKLSYHDCPEEYVDGAVNSGGGMMRSANCFIVTGTAVNTSPKPVVDADIFGRIYDADNNPVMQNRNRLGAIPYVPMGESEFELRITVPDKMKPPLKLDKFKASGFASNVSQFGNIDYDEFDVDEVAELEE